MTDASGTTSDRVGPYRLEHRLGAGGMGQVYGAFDERLERRVALKQILPGSASDSRVRRRFLREAQAAARLNHPAIVQIHDILEVDGCDWIVMELVDGDTLDDLIAKGALPVDRVLTLAVELAGGLEAAHGEGIVHRDLKAKNVLVTRKGRIKILDFGLAKPMEAEERELSISIAGQVVGTPRAMSPEQATGGEVDHRSDLFSLGTLLYEMATGMSPFTGPGVIATVTRVCTHRQQPAREVNPAVPAPFSELIDRLLEKEPAHRPQTAREVARELRGLSDTTALPASVPAAAVSASGAVTYDDSARSPATVERLRTTVERRQITVMSCELIDVDESAQGLDPEVLAQIVPELHTLVSTAIAEFDGHLGSVLGHRLVVYFGYPRAHEDDARRAVRAALRILAEIDDLNNRTDAGRPARLALRIGIHTGLAVVMPDPSGLEQVALGQTLEVTNRVERLAPPNTVVVSPSTHPLIEGFFVEEAMDPVELPGFGSPVPVHRVVGAHDIHTRVELAEPLLPLIGRQQELDLLLNRWQLARGGDGQVALLSGEAGIGKSRLVYTLERRLLEDGAQWWMCYGSPYAQSSPLRPLIELLRRALEIGSGEGSGQLERLEDSLRQYGFDLTEAMPLFAPLLGLELDQRYPPLPVSPEKLRAETMEAILTLLMEMADRQPLVLVVEDLHWMDPSTLELLGLLIDQAPAASVFLVLTFRNEFEAPWGHHAHLTQLNLNRLVGDELENLIDRVPGGKDLPAEIRQQIVDKTDGVPLFVEELTKTVLESGLLDDARGSSSIVASLDIPATLRDSLTARLDRLGTAKDVAQLASVIGRGFKYELLAAVSTLEKVELEDALTHLVEAELVMRRGFGSRVQYVFKHALIQDAAYDSLLKGTRRKHHRTIAQVLDEQLADNKEKRPELLAYHYTEAAIVDKAIGYWQQAANEALMRSANLEAIEHVNNGLGLIAALSDPSFRLRSELSLQVTQGAALMAVQGFASPEVGEVHARARALSEQVGETLEVFWGLRGLWLFYVASGELARALELGEQMMRLAEKQPDPELLISAYVSLSACLYFMGDLEAARELQEKAVVVDSVDRERSYSPTQDPGVENLCNSSVALWLQGYPDGALKRTQDAVDLARQLAHAFSEAIALYHSAWIRRLRGERAVLREEAEQVISFCEERGFPLWSTQSHTLLGWSLATGALAAEAERADEGSSDDSRQAERAEAPGQGLEYIHRGLEFFRATGARLTLTFHLANLTDSYLHRGKVAAGKKSLAEALALIEETGERFMEAELHRLAGELELIEDPDSETCQRQAESSFDRALKVARNQGAKSLELRVATSMSRLWWRQGKHAQARELLSHVYDWFSEGFETPDLKEAEALLQDFR